MSCSQYWYISSSPNCTSLQQQATMSPPTKKQRLLSPHHPSPTTQPQPDSPSSPPPTSKTAYSPSTPTLSTGTNHIKFLPSYSALPYSLEGNLNLFSRNSPPFLFRQPADLDFGAKLCPAWEGSQPGSHDAITKSEAPLARIQVRRRSSRPALLRRDSPGITWTKSDRSRSYLEEKLRQRMSEGEVERQRKTTVHSSGRRKCWTKGKKLRSRSETVQSSVKRRSVREKTRSLAAHVDRFFFPLEDLSLEDARRCV